MTKRKPPEEHKKNGRPTGYKPEYCEEAIAAGKLGKSKTWIAASFETTRETIDDWIRDNPEFSDAMQKARAASQKWWEDAGQNGMKAKTFNAAIWGKSVSCRFPDDWREKTETKNENIHMNPDGSPISGINVTITDPRSRT